MAEHVPVLVRTRLINLLSAGELPYSQPQPSSCLHIATFFRGKGMRAALAAGRARTMRMPMLMPDIFSLKLSLEVMEAKPERMLAQMQYAGVNKGMLQFAKMYGITNEYLSDCVRHWPHKFRACTAVDEDLADRPDQIDSLRHAVKDLGLTALYFECNGYGKSNYENHLDDAKYDAFWEEVQSLGIPVLWDIRVAVRRTSHAAYMEEVIGYSGRS